MAGTLSQTLKDHVTCPICLEQFQDPRYLPCLHTYCRKCLEDLLDKSSRRFSIKCPECREIFQVDNVTSLNVNIWANRDLDLLELSKTEEQKGEAVLMCSNDTCTGQAQAMCFDCEIFMCASCIKAHQLMSKATKDHHLMTLEDIKKKGVPPREKPTLCEKHKGKKQKLFCKQCETLICKDCTLIDHKDHDFAFIADVVEGQKGKVQEKLQDVCGTKKIIHYALNAVKNMQEKVRKNEETIKKEIDEKINAKIAILEEMRSKLKQESTNFAATQMKKLSIQQEGLEMHLAGLTSAVEFTENILAKGSNNDVLSMKKQIETRLSELSTKEIDGELEYRQILEVNEISYNDFENYLVIKDASVPDPKKSTVSWIKDTNNMCLKVRNCFNEPIDISIDRIRIVQHLCAFAPLTCHKIVGKKEGFEIKGWLSKDLFAIENLKVSIDGLTVHKDLL